MRQLNGRGILCAVVVAVIGMSCQRAHAINRTWNNAAGGNWNLPGNWTPVGVPGPLDHAIIDLPGLVVVSLNADVAISRLTLGTTVGSSSHSLDLQDHTLTINSALVSTIQPSGRLMLHNATVSMAAGELKNSGQVLCRSGDSVISGSFTNNSDGLLRVQVQGGTADAWLDVPNGFTNEGLVELRTVISAFNGVSLTGGQMVNPGTVHIYSADGSNGLRWLGAPVINSGTVTIDAQCQLGGFDVTWSNSSTGILEVNSGVSVEFLRPKSDRAVGLFNSGMIKVNAKASLVLNGDDPNALFQNLGEIEIVDGGTMTVFGGDTTMSGVMVLDGGSFVHQSGEIALNGELEQSPECSITLINCNAQLGVDFNNHGKLFLDGAVVTGGNSLINHSQLELRGATIGTLVNQGAVQVRPSLLTRVETSVIDGTFANPGTLTIIASDGMASALSLDDGFSNTGTIVLTGTPLGASMTVPDSFSGVIVNQLAGVIDVQAGGPRFINARISNAGQITLDETCIIKSPSSGPPSSNELGGEIFVNAGTLTFHTLGGGGQVALFNTGHIHVGPGAALTHSAPFALTNIWNNAAGVIDGVGNLVCTGFITNVGTLSPGPVNETGILNLQAFQYGQLGLGRLNIDIKGPTPGTSYDRVAASFNAVLAGKLFVSLDPSYNPPAGQTFDIVTYGSSVSGSFQLAFLPGFADERYMLVNYGSAAENAGGGSVTISVNQLQSISQFDDPETVPLPGAPTDGVLGDLDNNGTLDLAITIPDENPNDPGSVLILFNGGTVGDTWQGFTSSLQIPVGVGPAAITTGLFNGDAILDLAVAHTLNGITNGSVTILINSFGSPGSSFTPQAPIAVGVNPSSIASANLDNSAAEGTIGDDIIVTNRTSNTLTVLIKNTAPGISYTALVLPAGDDPIVIDPADVENDRGGGFVDLFVLNQASNDLWIYENIGGAFAAPVMYPVGTNPTGLAVGRLNNDEAVDIAVTNQGSNDVSILINQGTPTAFADAISIPMANGPLALALADLDNDHDVGTGFDDLDLAVLVIESGDPTVRVLRNDTDGATAGAPLSLAPGDEIGVDLGAFLVLAGDVDGLANGDDLVTVNNSDSPLAGGRVANLSVILNGAAPPCPGDIIGNGGVVNVDDLLLIINSWGTCDAPGPTDCPADITDNGVVDVDDLLAVVNSWGDCD